MVIAERVAGLAQDVLEILEELDGLILFTLLILIEQALLNFSLVLEAVSASRIFDAHVDAVHSRALRVEMLYAVVL